MEDAEQALNLLPHPLQLLGHLRSDQRVGVQEGVVPLLRHQDLAAGLAGAGAAGRAGGEPELEGHVLLAELVDEVEQAVLVALDRRDGVGEGVLEHDARGEHLEDVAYALAEGAPFVPGEF